MWANICVLRSALGGILISLRMDVEALDVKEGKSYDERLWKIMVQNLLLVPFDTLPDSYSF